jgi:hypothetical protein
MATDPRSWPGGVMTRAPPPQGRVIMGCAVETGWREVADTALGFITRFI